MVNNVEYAISEMISNRNTSYAYVIREGKFNILFKDTDIWHVIERFGNFWLTNWFLNKNYKQIIGAEYLSYKLHFYSGIEDRMNIVIQRCVEHGVAQYLVAKNKRLLSGSRLKDQEIISTTMQPVSLSDMQDTYLLYALGITLSSIIFLAERIIFWKMNQIKNNRVKLNWYSKLRGECFKKENIKELTVDTQYLILWVLH